MKARNTERSKPGNLSSTRRDNFVKVSRLVAVVYNPSKPELRQVLDKLVNLLNSEGVDFFLIKTEFFNFSASFDSYEGLKRPDFVVCVGGDGTILYAARLFAKLDVPIAGIDVGKLGFLMHFSVDDIPKIIGFIRSNNYEYEQRMMLDVVANFESGKTFSSIALNEVVVSRGKYHRLISICVEVDGERLINYRADGVIVATPTGSTAYSLSAFGPILIPTSDNIVITPICPHSLSARSVVIDGSSVVKLYVKHTEPMAQVVVDGQEYLEISENAEIIVRKSAYYAKVVKNPDISFFKILRKKLKWADDNM